jgi:arylsulfatase A-like enzyme
VAPARSVLLPLLLLVGCAAPQGAPAGRTPNVVFILTDNQGAWSLGCYGNRDIRTPNIDRLAAEGVRFSRCFSSNSVCSPTRATFLTGLIPSQHGIHCYLGGDEFQVGPNARCLIREFRSLPKILAEKGYVCGLSGKWHLGGNVTPQEGFTSWVTKPTGHTTTFHNAEVIEDGKVRKEPRHLTEFWTDRAVRFIDENRSRPFFLFLAYNGPYGLGESLVDGRRNRHTDHYADKEIPSFPREKMNPWLRVNKQYLNNPAAIRRYAAEVSAVDDGVGRILETLRERGLDRDTVVVLSADQGWAGGQHGIWGMGDHTRPLTAYDDQIHIPMIWRHPGRIPEGTTSDLLTSNYDFLPTLLGYLGVKEAPPAMPGRDLSAVLRGERCEGADAVFFEFENTRAIRTADWKYIRRIPDGPDELYDLKADPGERRNLVNSGNPADLRRRLEEFFGRHADPKYDLWNRGVSKVRRIIPP